MAIERAAAGESGGPGGPGAQPLTHVITLEHGEHNDSTLYRLERGSVLQFRPGPSLLGRKVFLYTNYVVADDAEDGSGAEFVRSQYYGLEWRRGPDDDEGPDDAAADGALGAGALITDTGLRCELRLARAGPFHYYFVYDTAECGAGPRGSGWFQVAPALAAGGRRVPLDAVCCQTVLAKALGPLPRWLPALQPAREAGYNMIHFTPVQELGASQSSYSIANQLRVDPRYGPDVSIADVENVVQRVRNEWKMLSICDIVLNHTANETPWLAEHPEAAYSALHCPHLRPAALLDAALARESGLLAAGALAAEGLPAALEGAEQLERLRAHLARRLPALRLHECFQCDAAELARQFLAAARAHVPPPPPAAAARPAPPPLRLLPDPLRRRRAATVDMDLALRHYNVHRAECGDEEARVRACAAELRRALDRLNEEAADTMEADLAAAVDNCIAGVRYERLEADGPRAGPVSAARPLVPPYFTWPRGAAQLPPEELEALVYGERGAQVMAHNGWVMAADPLDDFAAPAAGGRVYLRRELVAWGDSATSCLPRPRGTGVGGDAVIRSQRGCGRCSGRVSEHDACYRVPANACTPRARVKLRYGDGPASCPFLWNLMREYVELTAEVFDGVRLDNCHSTPLHVAEYLVDCARGVRPELFVLAELFTDSPHVDNIYVNRLGITSLVREAQAAWDSHEQGRLVHRFGGRPVGAFMRPPRRAARPAVAHAMLLDLTHDNPSPVQKRSVWDMLPTAGVVAMACCASGSSRGYDELVPHHVHVVDEERLYCSWDAADEGGEGRVGPRTGLMAARRALNELHQELAADGYDEVFVDQLDPDTVAITRHHPVSRKSVILVARNAFRAPAPGAAPPPPRDLRFEGVLDEVLLEAELLPDDTKGGAAESNKYITGLAGWRCSVRRGVPLAQSGVFAGSAREEGATVLRFRALPPGALVAVRVSPAARSAAALTALHAALPAPPATDPLRLAAPLAALDAADLAAVLYRCDAEERDATDGEVGVYDVPGHGPLVYAGLQGAASLLAAVRASDDLGHPLCENLRAGPWLADYTWRRLEREPRLAALAGAVRRALEPLADLPSFLRPAYFELLHGALHAAATRAALARLAPACTRDPLGAALALTSLQLVARVRSAPLPPLAVPAPGPPPPSMSAGLPHFATGYMRCWGRDTFISLRGLLLLTGRADDARAHILGYAACLRHGLIPNLLDSGVRARYNCRDAVWWWLYSIRQYCEEAPGGHALLREPVARLFPRDDDEAPPAGAAGAEQPLHAVMQEALDAHFQGRVFRERNAGRAIDAHMSDAGFTVQIGVRPDTGFPFGGNDHNAGTWMDKMGSSERAGNRGRPATPRDGSAVELVGLCHAVVSWLAAEHAVGHYPHAGVSRTHRDGAATAWSWAQWAERLRRAFERHFWVAGEPGAADERPDLVHRRHIYKDSVGASRAWADYQLRCNYVVAMAVAPELFDPRHAWLALDQVEAHLLGPLGLKTLDPADWNYRPNYDNADDSDDPSVAHGFNYHQGPEWLWPLGFYLRARLLFAGRAGAAARTAAAVTRALGPLAAELASSPWRGLPELCDAGGAPCAHSCRSQAWSAAVVLEVLRELQAVRRTGPPA